MLAGILLALLAQEQVDDIEFKAWSTFAPGSFVTYRVHAPGNDAAYEQKSTLKSVTEEEIVLTVEISAAGKPTGPATERRLAPKTDAGKTPKEVAQGEEELEVAGKKMKCRWTEFQRTLANGKLRSFKLWANDEVPGKAVRIDASTEDGKTSLIATAWEKK